MSDEINLSVILIARPEDETWRILLKDLTVLPKDSEIILVGPHFEEKNFNNAEETEARNIHFLKSALGRAVQLNAGASKAKGRYLWFLHSDTRIDHNAISALFLMLKKKPENALLYFNLAFQNDGPKLMSINSYFANLRSRILSIPFGDQGFCISKALFNKVGGYNEDCKEGEDHLFVWQCKKLAILFLQVNAYIYTSARKYRSNGWLATTIRHLFSFIRQVLIANKKNCKSCRKHLPAD